MEAGRVEAVAVLKGMNLYTAGASVASRKVAKALQGSKQLGPRQCQLVLTELAMRLWLEPLALKSSYYPDFETALRSHLAGKRDLEQHIAKLTNTDEFGASVLRLYCAFLRRMFAASGNAYDELYGEMLIAAGIRTNPSSVEFGKAAEAFYDKATESVHVERLLVFYSTGLLLKTYRATHQGHSSNLGCELELFFSYLEMRIPLASSFLSHAKDAEASMAITEELVRGLKQASRPTTQSLSVGKALGRTFLGSRLFGRERWKGRPASEIPKGP